MSIDTNHLDRALRVIPIDKENWLHNWIELGAKHVGIVQRLPATCRLHGINQREYFVDVLQRFCKHPASLVDALTPRFWQQIFAANLSRSDLQVLAQKRTRVASDNCLPLH